MQSTLENKSEKLFFSNITSNLDFFALPGFRKDFSKSDPQSALVQILTNFFRVHPNNMCLRVSKKDFNVSVQPASLSSNAFGALVLEIGNAHLENNRDNYWQIKYNVEYLKLPSQKSEIFFQQKAVFTKKFVLQRLEMVLKLNPECEVGTTFQL